MNGKAIRLRPHHGLCIRHFTGKGYSPAFVENMARVIAGLRAAPETDIELTAGADVLCASCPHNQSGWCASAPKPDRYDRAVLQYCGLRFGQRIPWDEFERRVEQQILRPGCLEQVCQGCQWLDICRGKAESVIIEINYTKCIILNDTFRIIIMIYTNRISPLAPLYRRSDSAPEEDTIAGAPPGPSLFGTEGRDQGFALPIPGFLRSHLTCKKKSVTIDRLARRANHSVEMMGWIRHRLKCLTLSSLFYLEEGEYEWTF